MLSWLSDFLFSSRNLISYSIIWKDSPATDVTQLLNTTFVPFFNLCYNRWFPVLRDRFQVYWPFKCFNNCPSICWSSHWQPRRQAVGSCWRVHVDFVLHDHSYLVFTHSVTRRYRDHLGAGSLSCTECWYSEFWSYVSCPELVSRHVCYRTNIL